MVYLCTYKPKDISHYKEMNTDSTIQKSFYGLPFASVGVVVWLLQKFFVLLHHRYIDKISYNNIINSMPTPDFVAEI